MTSALADYMQMVSALPVPADRGLRYLAIRLTALGRVGDNLAAAHLKQARTAVALSDPQLQDSPELRASVQKVMDDGASSESRYTQECITLAATEHVVLGTSLVRDYVSSEVMVAAPDSTAAVLALLEGLYAKKEQQVRAEMAALQ